MPFFYSFLNIYVHEEKWFTSSSADITDQKIIQSDGEIALGE